MENIARSQTGIYRKQFCKEVKLAEENAISPSLAFGVIKSIYPAECVIKAAYAFLDKAYVHIDEDDKCWIVILEAKATQLISQRELQQKFENELIAQSVRLAVFKRTHTLREMLLARAVSSSLIDGEEMIEPIDTDEQINQDEQLQHILKDWYEDNE